ncbi:TRAP transporter small permease [Anaerotruncus sp. AF02-27]|jgi:TRAP-type C4-dicarboxylate transport system permease small subunit|nr:TRAP transporter small permease [Anaerotruncus sp. AF02-27]
MFMNKVANVVDKVVCALLVIFFALILLVGTAQIISRYFFSMPIVWADELSKYLFLWMVMIGAAYGVRLKKHVVADVLITKFNPGLKKAVGLAVDLLSVFLFGVFIAYTPKMMRLAAGEISSTVRIPLSYVYLGVLVGAVLMLFYTLVDMYGKYVKKTAMEG